MMVYLITFLGSVLMIYYAESKHFAGWTTQISVSLALLLPCVVAGLRDISVGTDVQVYVENLFLVAKSEENIWDYLQSGYSRFGWDYTRVMDLEIGFVLLTFLIQRIFGSIQVLLFAIQALTVIPIYKGLRAFETNQPVWLGMTIYYLMFFNQTLNTMRQWIAMAILFYGFQFLVKKEHWKYFLAVLFATAFHLSALVGVVIFAIYQLIAKENTHNRTVKAAMLVLIGVITMFSLEIFAEIMNLFGLRYGVYIDGTLSLMPKQFLYRIPILLLLLLRWKYVKKMDRHASFYLTMIIYDVLASQLTSILGNSGRISLFFSEYYMLAYPAICAASGSKHNRRIMELFVLCYLCVYWYYVYVISGNGETVPYVSCFG